ncbi:Flavin-dependent monooxygenase, oxygenase subunit HsaA [Solibacillus isronensis B3W22]|uniref:Flavin-dependent monooxygenase, oxygenase subunit HsaA n=2 Tax=Solibacillus TaxID=648800 RepID=K1KIQ4_9BACL|nr:acyl-CoA dehydrogenase family protein [Solibacillus isronensis]EKB43970.1 Flavin-dependent monooxygenase, oxygenase subunit HsaA [Solibacillus isronensis B3W22]
MMTTALTERQIEVMNKMQEIAANVRKRVKETEEIRRIPEATMQELKDSGLMYILRPERYGGLQASVETYSQVIIELSKACASTGWIASLCAIRDIMVAESFNEKAHLEIFSDNPQDVLFAGVYEPRSCTVRKVEGGYLVEEGHWMFCSGSLHATWGYFGMYTKDENDNILEQLLMTVPFDVLEIEDDWHTLGLRGTGSNAVRMKNVFVPEHRVTSFVKILDGDFQSPHLRDIPLYNSALFPCLILSLGLPGLGVVKEMLDNFKQSLPYRTAQHMGVKMIKDAASTHHLLATAELKVETAELYFMNLAKSIDEWAAKGEIMPKDLRLKALADIGYANEMLNDAVQAILRASGSGFVYDASPMQRLLRDFLTLNSHRSLSPVITRENYGRQLAGLQPNQIRY